MTNAETILLEDASVLPTYPKWPFALVKGEDVFVWDADGNQYLDLYGGHCVTILGHCPQPVVEAVQRQAGELMFYSNVAYSPVRARAAALVNKLAPEGMGYPFFCNSGAEANETALKLARTFTGKSGIIAMNGGFHGRTIGSLATTSSEKLRKPYLHILPKTHFVQFGNIEDVEILLNAHDDIAAIIVEPIQGLAGMVDAPVEYFVALRSLCNQHNVCLIFDEVQTGVGRTGTFSIADQIGVIPDIITMAKSLASGIPAGMTICTKEIAETVQFGDHGSTFGGGMVAMAAVEATLTMLVEGEWMQRASILFDAFRNGTEKLGGTISGRGALIGLNFGCPAKPVIAALCERDILVGGADNPYVIRLMPSLTLPLDQVAFFFKQLEAVLNQVEVAA